MTRPSRLRAFFLTGLAVTTGIATQACSTNSEAAGAGWTFGPTLSSSPGPSGAASPAASGPTASDFASAFPSGAIPGGSQAPAGTIGPGTSSAPEPSGAPGS
jgi:hypothetical protein